MELPTLFANVGADGTITFDDSVFKRNTRVMCTQATSLDAFLESTLLPNGHAEYMPAFFEALGRIGVGKRAFTTISILLQDGKSHNISLVFVHDTRGIRCEVVDIRGYVRVATMYSETRLYRSLARLFRMANLYFVEKKLDGARKPYTIVPQPRYAWCAFMVPGDGYVDQGEPLQDEFLATNRPAVNCRVASYTYIWHRCRYSTRQQALSAFLKAMTRGNQA